MTTYKFYVSSSKNVSFRYEEEITLDMLGYDEKDWNELSDVEKDRELNEYCETLLFNRYIEFGYYEKD